MGAESVSWLPTNPNFSVNNNSSVIYNIINGEANNLSGIKKIKIFDKKVTNIKKGIAEFSDLSRSFFPNYNPDYPKFTKDGTFFRYKGLFSQMYDSAWRNGNLVIPFRDKKTEIVKEPDLSYDRSVSPKYNYLNTENNQSSSPKLRSKLLGSNGSGIINTSSNQNSSSLNMVNNAKSPKFRLGKKKITIKSQNQ